MPMSASSWSTRRQSLRRQQSAGRALAGDMGTYGVPHVQVAAAAPSAIH